YDMIAGGTKSGDRRGYAADVFPQLRESDGRERGEFGAEAMHNEAVLKGCVGGGASARALTDAAAFVDPPRIRSLSLA
ncbi:MAG: hypothetical protein ACI81R_001747, partial [Bradymonadia bacterium]